MEKPAFNSRLGFLVENCNYFVVGVKALDMYNLKPCKFVNF